MKEDVLNLIATWGVLAEAVNALFTLAALLIYGFLAWAGIRICRNVLDAFTRAIRLCNDIQQPRKEES